MENLKIEIEDDKIVCYSRKSVSKVLGVNSYCNEWIPKLERFEIDDEGLRRKFKFVFPIESFLERLENKKEQIKKLKKQIKGMNKLRRKLKIK